MKNKIKQTGDLEELASLYGMNPDSLKLSLDKYNHHMEQQTDDEFGKPVLNGVKPVCQPPYYSIRLWPKVHHTMGGIQINTSGQVIDTNQKPIEGLYAAGEVTGGIHGACRLGSCAVTDCLVFGRIAGRNAALNL
ncbi:MAG: FAD-binding protein [Limnochordia bacterium]|nr:FAD-binding protein [Limnochordia bacterium]MDD5605666.1 FAD-binding protein [Dehalococcoidales bacterium]